MDTIKRLNAWALTHKLNLKAESSTTGKGGTVRAVLVTLDASAVSALIQTEEFPIGVKDLAPNGASILKQLPGSSGMFRFKVPESILGSSEDTLDVASLLSGAKILGSSGPSTGECNWTFPQFANANNTGIYSPMLIQAWDKFRESWKVEITETVLTVSELPPSEPSEPEKVLRRFEFDAQKQDDQGKSGSTDGYTATHCFKILNGILLEWAKTGVPSKTGRGGTTS